MIHYAGSAEVAVLNMATVVIDIHRFANARGKGRRQRQTAATLLPCFDAIHPRGPGQARYFRSLFGQIYPFSILSLDLVRYRAYYCSVENLRLKDRADHQRCSRGIGNIVPVPVPPGGRTKRETLLFLGEQGNCARWKSSGVRPRGEPSWISCYRMRPGSTAVYQRSRPHRRQ